MIAEPDIDLEELESRLYSQVFHTNNEDVTNQVVSGRNEQFNDNNSTNKMNRYFQPNKFNPKLKLDYNNEKRDFIPMGFSKGNQVVPVESSRSHYGWNQNDMSQVIRMLNPINNFVVLPQIPTRVLSPSIKKYLERRASLIDKRKARRKARRKEKKLERKFHGQMKVENVSDKAGDFTVHYMNQNDAGQSKIEIIDVIDSDDSCVEIVNDTELVVLSSDDAEDTNSELQCELIPKKEEINLKDGLNTTDIKNKDEVKHDGDDDVLLIEPKAIEIVVINVDGDTDCATDMNKESIADEDASKQINSDKSTETTSISSDISQIPLTPGPKTKKTIKERKELLSTPDSTLSNDFLDPSMSLKEDNFNFGLHGNDFRHSHSFLKPKCLADVYETESSCSASDISASVKNPLFNEVEFEAPKQAFDAANIENFGNYITPHRQRETHATLSNFEQIETKVTKKYGELLEALNDGSSNSGSSSESEYESTKVTYLDKIKKTLPTLSPIQSDDENNKNKKGLNAEITASTSNECVVNMDDSISKKRKSHLSGESVIKKNRKEEDPIMKNKKILEKEENSSNKANKNMEKLTDETCTNKNKVSRNQTCEEEPINAKNVSQTVGDVSNITIIDDSSDEDNFDTCELENVKTDLKLINFASDSRNYEKSNSQKRKRFLDYWSTDMETYYNSNLDLEHFSVAASQKSMSDDPKLWKILDRDRVHIRLGTPKGLRCHRCRQFGHMMMNCPNKQGPPSCTLCGLKGHLEPRCPNAMCTSCGRLGAYTTYCSKCAHYRNIQCTTCKMYGHYDNRCPDLWRRYHLTITPGPIVKPDSHQSKPRKKRWCSGCSMSGHYEHTCRFYHRMHHPTDPEIKRYVDVAGYLPTPSTSKASADEIPEIKSRNSSHKMHEVKSNQKLEPKRYDEFISISFDKYPTFPPLRMIPPYFQEQLAYLRGENFKKQPAKIPSVNKSDYTFTSKLTPSFIGFNFQRSLINNICKVNVRNPAEETVSENYTSNIHLNRFRYAYIHSMKGIDYINNIRRKTSVVVTITNNNDDSDGGGIITLRGNQKETCDIHQQLIDFIDTTPHNILPVDSKLAYITIHKNIEMLENTKGNCKDIFDAISAKELLLETNDKRNAKSGSDVMELYSTLHMMLFGRCKVKNGDKHVNILYSWLEKLRNAVPHELPLNAAYDIYESFSYVFVPKLQKDDYRCLAESANYYVPQMQSTKKDRPKEHEMSRKEKGVFLQKSMLVTQKCKTHKMYKELKEFHCLQDAVIKSDYSKYAFSDFMKFVRNFTKQFF